MYKLLVVDDEHDTRDTLCHCFPWESVGFTIVKQLNNGREALDYLQEHPVHAALCDIKMPVMNGIELTREICERKIPVHIVLLSAYRDFEYAREAMQYGARQYMVKPAKYNEMIRVFTELKQELDQSVSHMSAAVPKVHTQPVPQHPITGMDDPVIFQIVELINGSYRTVTLQKAADLVHMNASYLSAYFKKRAGTNFSDYVQRVRMEKAAELLKVKHMKAYEVSELVGYVNDKNFIRSFKQYYGTTPGQYKNER
jgi:two-component system response regulator YesN